MKTYLSTDTLIREDWDFSKLPTEELIPTLLWEMNRECKNVERDVIAGRAWLSGKVSEKKSPMPVDKRTGKRPRYNINLSEADTVRIRITNAFSEFIPYYEFHWLHKGTPREKREYSQCWLVRQIAPLLKSFPTPWLCLPESERHRLTNLYHSGRSAQIVSIGSWWDAISYIKRHKMDAGLPLKFDFYEKTSVLLTIDWKHSRKSILGVIGKMLKQFEPANVKRWNPRGRKDRDLLVTLERLALMRLLHNYTLSEIRRLLPEAWHLYENRKWYDDRRQALKDFRSIVGFREPEKHFPKSWETKARRSELPGK